MTGTLHEDQHTFVIMPRRILLRVRNISGEKKSYRENQNTHFVFCNFLFFRQSFRLWDNVEKYGTAGQAADDNMVDAHCVLET